MQTVEAVAQENGAVIDALGPHGVAVFPADDDYAPIWQAKADQRRSVCFDLSPSKADGVLGCHEARWESGRWHVVAQGLGVTLKYRLAIAGKHNVKNSLAAAACALSAGVPVDAVVKGLEAFEPVKGRSRALALVVQGRAVTLVDDTYNANPDSVRAAIDVLADLPGPHLLVLGDMGEVGHQGPQFHSEAGRYANTRGIAHLMLLGDASTAAADAFEGALHFGSVDELITEVTATLPRVQSVLVKGSRFMRMERVVNAALAANPVHEERAHAN
jgi:UDP-N-acetylmuramoyl-tripeptide--D-alanyl-D-alanine ligase